MNSCLSKCGVQVLHRYFTVWNIKWSSGVPSSLVRYESEEIRNNKGKPGKNRNFINDIASSSSAVVETREELITRNDSAVWPQVAFNATSYDFLRQHHLSRRTIIMMTNCCDCRRMNRNLNALKEPFDRVSQAQMNF